MLKKVMTPKKLQKLTYYAEAWANALLWWRNSLSDTAFQAWVHGQFMLNFEMIIKEYG
nr:hypothetical protein [Mycoplasmopsis bovis]